MGLARVLTAPAAGIDQIAEPKVEDRRESDFSAAVVLLSNRWANVTPHRAEAVRRGQEGKHGDNLAVHHRLQRANDVPFREQRKFDEAWNQGFNLRHRRACRRCLRHPARTTGVEIYGRRRKSWYRTVW